MPVRYSAYSAAVTRLAQYEDTRLTPEQVAEVVKERGELRAKYDEAREVFSCIVKYVTAYEPRRKDLHMFVSDEMFDRLRRIAGDND
jgi:hypothetical protein